MDLSHAFASAIDLADVEAIVDSLSATRSTPEMRLTLDTRSALAGSSKETRPVLQLNALPCTLDPLLFVNPLSSSNPNGNLKSLFAFRELVDPVPSFSKAYSSSGASTEGIYKQIVKGASVGIDSSFTAGMIADAQRQFSENQFADMDGTPGHWCPVYAVPEDWYDTSQSSRYKEIDIDLYDQGGKDSPFIVLGGQSALELTVAGNRTNSTSLDSRTNLRSVRMKYLLVQFRRPWLNLLLFESGGWYLSSQPQGFCSSGKTDENNGVLPLLPTGMLLAKDVSIQAEWSKKDQSFLDSAKSTKEPVFLGPFALESQGLGSSLQIIGWISSLVPYSPKSE